MRDRTMRGTREHGSEQMLSATTVHTTARRGQAMRRDRGGLTLTELLVAMSILLVGIYAVATGFPALFGTLESDRIRSEMARQAEARLETFKTASFRIPDAIAGHDALDGTVIPPDVYPDESMDPIPGNPRDDLTWVLGEGLQVPMARVGDTYAVYPLN